MAPLPRRRGKGQDVTLSIRLRGKEIGQVSHYNARFHTGDVCLKGYEIEAETGGCGATREAPL